MWFVPFLWFVTITGAVVWALPRVFDALLYYFDQRNKQYNQMIEQETRLLEIKKQQYKLQEMERQRRAGK